MPTPLLVVDVQQCFLNEFTRHVPERLGERLRDQETDEVVMVGIDTDMCVLKIAMDVFDLGIRPIVMIDCCASTAGLQAHLAGLAVLSRNIEAPQLREAGLSDGLIAAPIDQVDQADAGI